MKILFLILIITGCVFSQERAPFISIEKLIFVSMSVTANYIHAKENHYTSLSARTKNRRYNELWHHYQDYDRYSQIILGTSIALDSYDKDLDWWEIGLRGLSDVLLNEAIHGVMHKGLLNTFNNRPWWHEKYTSSYFDNKQYLKFLHTPFGKISLLVISLALNYIIFQCL